MGLRKRLRNLEGYFLWREEQFAKLERDLVTLKLECIFLLFCGCFCGYDARYFRKLRKEDTDSVTDPTYDPTYFLLTYILGVIIFHQ